MGKTFSSFFMFIIVYFGFVLKKRMKVNGLNLRSYTLYKLFSRSVLDSVIKVFDKKRVREKKKGKKKGVLITEKSE